MCYEHGANEKNQNETTGTFTVNSLHTVQNSTQDAAVQPLPTLLCPVTSTPSRTECSKNIYFNIGYTVISMMHNDLM